MATDIAFALAVLALAGTVSATAQWMDDVELSPTGRSEAENLAAIYSSPLRRAAQTARLITEWTGLSVAHLPQLMEIYCGEVEGLLLEHVQRTHRARWFDNLRPEDPDFRWPGGESYREFRARCLAGVAQIAARHRAQRVAIVTHAGVISQLIGHIRGLTPARWDSFRAGTASLTALEWREGSGTLLSFDDRAHLRRHQRHALMRTEHQLE